jgi:3-deoxy-D-manno-octulosonic-acid transferase
LRERNLRSIRRSVAESATPPLDCLLIDTTGELPDWYRVATVVFIGKSMTGHGGQNPVEAIIAGKPVIFGPYMENFANLSAQLVAADGAFCVSTTAEFIDQAQRLLTDPELRERIVEAARRVLAPHRGATARTAAIIDKITSSGAAQIRERNR